MESGSVSWLDVHTGPGFGRILAGHERWNEISLVLKRNITSMEKTKSSQDKKLPYYSHCSIE